MFEQIDSYPDCGAYGSVAITAIAAAQGADIVRVHDVAENNTAIRAVGATNAGISREK